MLRAPEDSPFTEDDYVIAECYYNEDDSIMGWSLGSESGWGEAPHGETIAELKQSIEWMLAALDKPVLNEAELLKEMETSQTWYNDQEFIDALSRDESEKVPLELPDEFLGDVRYIYDEEE